MKKAIAFIVLILIASQATAWDCKTQTKRELYDEYEVVLIGKILRVDSLSYLVAVQEMFKGSQHDTLVGELWAETYGASIRPERGETWLIYGDIRNGNLLAGDCSGSRSFDFPYSFHMIASPTPPPRQMGEITEVEMFILRNIDLDKALNELYYDIITLRQWKLEEKIKSKEPIEERDNNKFYVLYGAQGLILILLALLLFKRKMN